MMKKEIKDAVSLLDNILNKLNDRLNKIDDRLNKLDDRTHTLAVDIAYVKAHLGLTELKQDSPATPVSPSQTKDHIIAE
ncbi:2997_t:CDS:2 [Funneliformis mosseae]|uniref:2997_t:CDS:1 n=1 Tax=Funneliformis mosseae TaxID=27381 RepID=A0A9N8VAH8_FUNMO|nr:2997_t:CDS:2 [Funneliformis mosseae]